MNTLYDSDSFTVTHMLANAQVQTDSSAAFLGQGNTTLSDVKTDQYPQGVPMLERPGFRFLAKGPGNKVILMGSGPGWFR